MVELTGKAKARNGSLPHYMHSLFTDDELEPGETLTRTTIPESVLKRCVEQRKGQQFYDKKHDSYQFVYNKTVIIVDKELEKIITMWREDNPVGKRKKSGRYEQVRLKQ